MADVDWIKITTNIFENRKIKQILPLPEGNTLFVIWIKLLCLAGTINDNGAVYITKKLPYTDQSLSVEFKNQLTTIQLALNTFETFGMIEYIDGFLYICNWEKYQNTDGLAKIREQNRIRKQRERERKKILLEDKSNVSQVTSRDSHATDKIREDKNRIEKIREEEKETMIDYESIMNMFHMFCPSFNKIKKITFSRKKALDECIKTYSKEDLETIFKKAESSQFLKGNNDRSWKASFDWIINDGNLAKILEGNYDDHQTSKSINSLSMQQDYDFEKIEEMNDPDFDEKRQQLQEKLKGKYGK